MGEANSEAIALITDMIGHRPRSGKTPDGRQCLQIGNTVVVATGLALWSDPSAWSNDDDSLTVRWGGQIVNFSRDPRGTWTAKIHRDPLQGKARWVD